MKAKLRKNLVLWLTLLALAIFFIAAARGMDAMDPVTRLTLTITHLFDRSGERWRVYVVTFATLAFILAIAVTVQFTEMVMRRTSPLLYRVLGIFLPLITTNCSVLGVCLILINAEYNFMQALVASFSYAVGFALALILFAGLRERILIARVPRPLQDTSIGLVTAGILSLAFFAFKGMV